MSRSQLGFFRDLLVKVPAAGCWFGVVSAGPEAMAGKYVCRGGIFFVIPVVVSD